METTTDQPSIIPSPVNAREVTPPKVIEKAYDGRENLSDGGKPSSFYDCKSVEPEPEPEPEPEQSTFEFDPELWDILHENLAVHKSNLCLVIGRETIVPFRSVTMMQVYLAPESSFLGAIVLDEGVLKIRGNATREQRFRIRQRLLRFIGAFC